jgi:hypothetical protein
MRLLPFLRAHLGAELFVLETSHNTALAHLTPAGRAADYAPGPCPYAPRAADCQRGVACPFIHSGRVGRW